MSNAAQPPLSAEDLAKLEADIAWQEAADLDTSVETDAQLHLLADKLHNQAFAKDGQKPSFADSLQAAATQMIAEGAKLANFPPAALNRLRLYAPEIPASKDSVAVVDPVAEAETAAATHDAV